MKITIIKMSDGVNLGAVLYDASSVIAPCTREPRKAEGNHPSIGGSPQSFLELYFSLRRELVELGVIPKDDLKALVDHIERLSDKIMNGTIQSEQRFRALFHAVDHLCNRRQHYTEAIVYVSELQALLQEALIP